MPKVLYTQNLERSIEVEISEEDLATLKNPDLPDEARQTAIDNVLGLALAIIENEPLQFVSGFCEYQGSEDEPIEELFDVG